MAREAAVLGALDHPAIGRLLDAGEQDGEPFLAFTLYDAGTLAAHLDHGRMAAADAAAMLAPIADALAFVHDRGIVHRDVKPANVLCTVDGPVLVDFSIASVTGSTYDGWIDGAPAVAGTEGYRAPEAGSDGGAPSPALDVYALGVSLIEAVTGRRDAVLDDAQRTFLGPLADLAEACVALDAASRPSAATVAARLRAVAGDRRPAVEPPPSVGAVSVTVAAARVEAGARAEELARLDASFTDGLATDELRAVLVVAPAGAGKTWLVSHAATAVAGSVHSPRVLSARCTDAVGDPTVLRAWLRPLLDRERERGRDPVDVLAETVGRTAASAVARVLGVARATNAGGGSGGDADMGVVSDALAHLLSSMGPVVAIVEDLHRASLELLDVLARLAHHAGVPGALWCTTRPGFVDADDLDFETVALAPLDDRAIAAVVADVLEDPTGRVVAQVLSVAGGNPLHAREAALAARRGDGARALGSLPELIADRFDHLDAVARDAVAIAAACGDTFWPEAVGGELLAATPLLYQSGVAQVRMTSTIAGSTEAGWSHPLLQEVAYDRLPASRRRELHARLGGRLDTAGATPEVVARQAGLAFRLGEASVAPLAGRAGAAAARDALDRFALSGAATWIELVRDSGHEPVAGTADVLDAELRVSRGEFEPAARLVRPLTTRDDDIGTQALVLATEATAGAGDLRAAEQFGERARARLGDDPKLAASFGGVLARRGRLEDSLALLDSAAKRAREGGDDAFAARLAAQAANVAADLAQARAEPFKDAIARARAALDELRTLGDRRRFAQSVDGLFGMINIDYPHEAMALAIEAAEIAQGVGDDVAYGRATYRVCDAALDLCDVQTFEKWAPKLEACSLPALKRTEAELLTLTFRVLRSGDPRGAVAEFTSVAERMRALGESSPAAASALAVSVPLWCGRPDEAKALLDSELGSRLSPAHRDIVVMTIRMLEGPSWELDDLPTPQGTLANPVLALLHMLRGERQAADALLLERYSDRVSSVGHAFQRLTPFYPGPLIASLGPSSTKPDLAWLRQWIFAAPLPGLWVTHRAVAAVLLAERAPEDKATLARAALSLLDSIEVEPELAWLSARATALL